MNLKKLKAEIRKFAAKPQFLKEAEIGGGVDQSFESAFSNLAHAYLKDKAPSLQDYEVGFQLIDRNQENTKAIGVFGFKVGHQWLYAPVFFLNGDLKGHELLYIKNQDLFVPLKENWLNYLMNRKPHVLGHGVGKDLSSLGVVPPNLYQLSKSPAKYASVHEHTEWAKAIIPDLAYFASTSPLQDEKYSRVKTVLDFLKDAGELGVNALIETVTLYPQIHKAMNDVYGDELDKAVKEAAKKTGELEKKALLGKIPTALAIADLVSRRRPEKKKPLVAPAQLISPDTETNTEPGDKLASVNNQISVITYKRVMEVPAIGATLEDNEKEHLAKGNVVIKDDRDDKDITIAYNIDVPQQLQSPTETGLYEVLTKPGEFKKCLVVIGPYSEAGRKNFALIVDVENKNWINTHQSQVWTKLKYEKEVFLNWLKDLPSSKDISSGLQILIGPTGQSTLPFRSYESIDGKEADVYEVHFYTHAKKETPGSLVGKQEEVEPLLLRSHSTPKIVCTKHKSKNLRSLGTELIVPDGFKVLKLDKDNTCGCGVDSDPPAVLDLGSMVDLHMNIIKSGHLHQLSIRNTGTHININNSPDLTYNSALIDLVENKGLREKQAKDLLAIGKDKKYQRFLVHYGPTYVKSAVTDYELQRSGPSAPPIPEPALSLDPMTGGQVPTQAAQEANIPIPDMQSMMYDRSVYDPRPVATSQANMVGGTNDPGPDKDALNTAMQAAKSGQKEVFDTAMLGSLLKTVKDDSMVDKYMGDLMKGMDRLARILFLFYWHQDEFEERYGKQDLPELEDGLRNAFEAIGDIILFLKQKTIEPYPEEISDVDLKSVAAS